ncbi:hypothetical protein GCM10022220_68570 [Actinocatenispora rupis]|uniref:Uncharacterized protein n=1 Tax=Actinocatenispora rupis TaxID=519421 RepID=A0A8J3NES1_9ACTN|nr:hypothetical protein Aru02nite_52810 [Actinocatenispora rupis]
MLRLAGLGGTVASAVAALALLCFAVLARPSLRSANLVVRAFAALGPARCASHCWAWRQALAVLGFVVFRFADKAFAALGESFCACLRFARCLAVVAFAALGPGC